MRCPNQLISINLCYFVVSSSLHQLSTLQTLSQRKAAQLARVATTVECHCKETAGHVTPSIILVVVVAEIGHITKMVQMEETTITATQPQIGNLLHQEWSAISLVAHPHLLGLTMPIGRRPDLRLPTVVSLEDLPALVANREEALETIMVVDRMTLIEAEMIRTDHKVVTRAEDKEEIHIVAGTEGVEHKTRINGGTGRAAHSKSG